MSGSKLAIFVLFLFLSGCAATGDVVVDPLDNRADGLEDVRFKSHESQSQIAVLKNQLQEKDRLIASLQESLDKESKEKALLEDQVGVLTGKYKATPFDPIVKSAQAALKNAGYDPGSIDGIMGSKTRQALRRLQADNKLTVTGNADSQTQLLLKKYLIDEKEKVRIAD